MRDSQGGGESDLADDVRRRCMKNSPSFLSCIGKRPKKAVTVAAKSRQFTADKTGKGQFLRGNQRNLAGEGVVRKNSSPQRVASVSNLCNNRRQKHGQRGVLLRFWQASLPIYFREIQHDRGPTGSLELPGRRGSRKDPKYPRRILVGETLGPRREG